MGNMCASECKAEQKTRLNMAGRHAAFSGKEDQFWKKVEFTPEWYRRYLSQDDLWYLPLDTEDHFDYPLSDKFDEVSEFLNACRLDGRKVLVHCIMGMNRSAFATAAFLMRWGTVRGEDGLDVKSAVDWISSRRLDVMKNQSFLKQLVSYGQKSPATGSFAPALVARAATPCLLAQSSVQQKLKPPLGARRISKCDDSRLGTPAPYKTPIKLLDTQLKLSPLCPSTEAVARIFVRNPAENAVRPRRLSLGKSGECQEEGLDAALSSKLSGPVNEWKVSNSRVTPLRSRSTGGLGGYTANAGPRRALAMHCESKKQGNLEGSVSATATAAAAC